MGDELKYVRMENVAMSNKILLGLLASLSVLIGTAVDAAESQAQRAETATETQRPDTGTTGGTGGEETGGKQAEPAGGGATTLGQPPGGSENHAQEALKHAKAAAASGKKGDFSSIAKHAKLSKTHVEAALKDKPDDSHLQAALKSLDEAITEANRGNGGPARKAAKEAVSHLNAVK
jgi:hypothetical protein